MGLATAEALSAEGANVAMFARRRDELEREAERLGALAVRGDLTNPKDLKKLVDKTKARLRRDGVPFAENIPLGIMLEVPAIRSGNVSVANS